jgi:hypothetical protein
MNEQQCKYKPIIDNMHGSIDYNSGSRIFWYDYRANMQQQTHHYFLHGNIINTLILSIKAYVVLGDKITVSLCALYYSNRCFQKEQLSSLCRIISLLSKTHKKHSMVTRKKRHAYIADWEHIHQHRGLIQLLQINASRLRSFDLCPRMVRRGQQPPPWNQSKWPTSRGVASLAKNGIKEYLLSGTSQEL